MFATADELRALLGEDAESLPDAQADLLLGLASAEVKAAAGQDIELIMGDIANLTGDTGSWLRLPQIPVGAVTLVKVDGAVVTDYKVFGSRLWRACGWAVSAYEPSAVEVTYTHGYAPDDPRLDLAKKETLALAAAVFENPGGAGGYAIDDYREQGAAGVGGGARGNQLSPASRRLLRRTYGPRGALTRIG